MKSLANVEAFSTLPHAEPQEAKAGKPNPNATPIDKETKEALKEQVAQAAAEKKQLAEESEKAGHAILPDLSKTLADTNRMQRGRR